VADSGEVSSSGRRRRRRDQEAPRRLQARRAAGFLIALVLTLVLAFNGGGYDVVIRHQVGIAVWAAIALGLGVGVLPRARLNTAVWVALLGFVALAFLTLLSHAWSKSDERTTEELARVLEYLGVVLLAVLTLNRYSWRGAALGFAAGALIVPFFSVGARVFPHLLTDPLAQDFHFDRLSYPLGYWNGVACWGAMAIAVGLCLSANAAREWVRALGLACVPVAALSVYLTYSRFGVAATAVAVIAAVAVSRHRWTAGAHALVAGAASAVVILVARGQPEIADATGGAGGGTVALLLGGVAVGCGLMTLITSRARLDGVRINARSARVSLATAGVGLLLAAVALHSPLNTAWEKFKNDKPPPAGGPARVTSSLGSSRYSVWTKGVDAFQSDSLRGIGAGNFEFYWSRHGDSPEFIRDAHSLYIEQAAELGVPGLLALLTALGGLLWAALLGRARWRRGVEVAAGSAMIAAFVVFLVYAGVDWMWELGAVGTLALGGAAVAGAGGLERVGESAISPWVRAAAVAAALLIGAVQVPGLVSTERTRASQSALARGDAKRAQDLADQAITAEDWAASPYAARALATEGLGDLAGAKRDAQQAIDREPVNWRNHLLMARILAEQGDRSGARAQLAAARRLAPLNPYLASFSPYMRQLNSLLRDGNGATPKAGAGR
jgi:O-antigen ligase/polysaccharide polymerase Wzy-like membrane protein